MEKFKTTVALRVVWVGVLNSTRRKSSTCKSLFVEGWCKCCIGRSCQKKICMKRSTCENSTRSPFPPAKRQRTGLQRGKVLCEIGIGIYRIQSLRTDLMGVNLLNQLHCIMPLHSDPFSLSDGQRVGLVIVDEVNGFCTVGAGNLAPQSSNPQITAMIEETNRLAREFSTRNWPMLVLLDTHDASKPEIPYPPHCINGSGEENLVPTLKWLEQDRNAFLMRKDCINGFIGGLQADGSNLISEWVQKNKVQVMLVVGICTDICVLDFVVTVLSARNHGILPPLKEVVVYSKACATYDLPVEIAKGIDGALAHPQAVAHYLGLYMAKSRGALVADSISFPKASSHA